MARRSRTAILKRQGERKRAEKVEAKRPERRERQNAPSAGQAVASQDDLAALSLADPVARGRPERRPERRMKSGAVRRNLAPRRE
jgi:hypothetical protein